ncbi:putative glycolipid-binding protein [Aspergillus cavernicola]|uniref:Glycolipid-binding protein n=1 Tax=Aspergillus cavernicola TaxID=176166 RepID=A0ABR4J713_9EURO
MTEPKWMRWISTFEMEGAETVRIESTQRGFRASGELVYKQDEEESYHGITYRILVDEEERVRKVKIKDSKTGEKIFLRADGRGRWSTGDGEPLPGLDGCIDIDISTSVFTKKIPISHLELGEEEEKCIRVVYIPLSSGGPLEVLAEEQRYTYIERDPKYVDDYSMLYRYERLSSGFKKEFITDEEGFFGEFGQQMVPRRKDD